MAKTKALISCAVTAQLICVFVFAYAKSRFSHNEVHLMKLMIPVDIHFVLLSLYELMDAASIARA